MYLPKFTEETDLCVLHDLIRAKPLGAWTSLAEGALCTDHIPFVLRADRGEFGTLEGHVARANPIWRSFSQVVESVVIFQGEQAYISPSWYPSKADHGKVVPTWNYAVVHAYGLPKIRQDSEWLLKHLQELTDLFESARAEPWRVSDAPPEFIAKLSRAIVGIEIPISRLTGKWKLGQNRSATDRWGMLAGLSASEDADAQGLARLLHQTLNADKPA